MTNEELKKILTLLGLLAIASCGGAGSSGDATHSAKFGGLALKVESASKFSPAIDHAKIGKYRVKIEAADMTEPIMAEFEGAAASGVIENVPSGENRIVSVEAVNLNDATIKAGETFGVEIGGGENEVNVELQAVPIFTNLAKEAAIDNTRLVFHVFSDPSHPVVIEEIKEDKNDAVFDAATNTSQLNLDAATGLGKMAPKLISPGVRKFIVRDIVTGRSSETKVTLLDGSLARPAPFAAAASVSKRAVSTLSSITK